MSRCHPFQSCFRHVRHKRICRALDNGLSTFSLYIDEPAHAVIEPATKRNTGDASTMTARNGPEHRVYRGTGPISVGPWLSLSRSPSVQR